MKNLLKLWAVTIAAWTNKSDVKEVDNEINEVDNRRIGRYFRVAATDETNKKFTIVCKTERATDKVFNSAKEAEDYASGIDWDMVGIIAYHWANLMTDKLREELKKGGEK